MKAALADHNLDAGSNHSFHAFIPQLQDHQHHYTGPVCNSRVLLIAFSIFCAWMGIAFHDPCDSAVSAGAGHFWKQLLLM